MPLLSVLVHYSAPPAQAGDGRCDIAVALMPVDHALQREGLAFTWPTIRLVPTSVADCSPEPGYRIEASATGRQQQRWLQSR